MGCVLGCFRIKDDEQGRSHLLARLIPSKNKGYLPWSKQQAPVHKCEGPPCDGESSDTKLIPEHDQLFLSQALLCEDSSLPENNSAGYDLAGGQALGCSGNSLPPVTSCKSIDSGDHKDESGVEPKSVTLDISSHQKFRQVKSLDSTRSPYPTPLKLTDEMQTPFTVYPDNVENLGTRKNAGIRAQLVYPVLNSVANVPQWKALKEKSSRLCQSIDLFGQEISCYSPDSRKNPTNLQQSSPASLCNESPNDKREGINPDSVEPPLHSREKILLSPENPHLVDSDISQLLTPLPVEDDRGWSCKTVTLIKDFDSKETPHGDGPSFGFVTAHWNNDGPYCTSPKLWDGNGIPNTTRKYKEDQKVTWHATPFEERLEKVLSHDNLLPQRRLIEGEPTIFED